MNRGPSFAAKAFASEHPGSNAIGVWPIAPEVERRMVLHISGVGGGPIWHALGSAFGLEVRDPTSDVRLIEYCLALPDDQHVKGGQSRSVLRRSMSRIMPDSVRLRDRRGLQCADCAFRLAARETDVVAALDRLERSEAVRSYLDLGLLRQTWASVRENPSTPRAWLSAQMLLRAIMAGRFLERLAPTEFENRNPRQ